MALEVYTLALVTIDGSLLTEEASITIDRDSRAQEVSTVAKQFSGMSPGAGIMHIDVENGVPAADFELNPGKYFAKFLKPVEIAIYAAGRRLVTQGFIPKDTFRHGVSAEAKVSFHATCQMADWE